MELLHRKNKLEQLTEAVSGHEALKGAAVSTIQSALDNNQAANGNGHHRGAASSRGLRRPGLIAVGGAAGITAASAAISAIRRRGSSV